MSARGGIHSQTNPALDDLGLEILNTLSRTKIIFSLVRISLYTGTEYIPQWLGEKSKILFLVDTFHLDCALL